MGTDERTGRLTASFIDSADPLAKFYIYGDEEITVEHCNDGIKIYSKDTLLLSGAGFTDHSVDAPLIIKIKGGRKA